MFGDNGKYIRIRLVINNLCSLESTDRVACARGARNT